MAENRFSENHHYDCKDRSSLNKKIAKTSSGDVVMSSVTANRSTRSTNNYEFPQKSNVEMRMTSSSNSAATRIDESDSTNCRRHSNLPLSISVKSMLTRNFKGRPRRDST